MIAENVVEKAIQLCESAEIDTPIAEDQLQEYLDFVGADYLPDADRVLLEFLLQTINKAAELSSHAIDWHHDTIERISEDNWKSFEVEFKQDLPAYINHSFELGEEEELMAIVEDSLHEDLEKENRALIWLACLTVIDALGEVE